MIFGLIAQIKATASVTALLGTGVFLAVLPQGTPTGIVVKRIGGSSQATFDTSGFQQVRVQVDFMSTDPVAAVNGQAAFRQAFEGFVGALPDGTRIQNCLWINDRDAYEYEPRQFSCSTEYYFQFTLS